MAPKATVSSRKFWAKNKKNANISKKKQNALTPPVSNNSSSNHSSRTAPTSTPSSQRRINSTPRTSSSTIVSRDTSCALQPQTIEEQVEDDLDVLSEIIMAVDLRNRGTVGCCYYDAYTEKLHFMEDAKFGNIEIIQMLKLFINPTVIIVPTSIDEGVLEALDPKLCQPRSENDADGSPNPPHLFEQRSMSEFNYDTAKNKLIDLRIGSTYGPQVSFIIPGDINAACNQESSNEDEPVGREARLLKLSTWISLDSRVTVGCAGAVLAYLQRRRATRFLPSDSAADAYLRIATIEMFSLRDIMFVNNDTLISLQIMKSESHPHAHNQGPSKQSPGSKEGLSVYGLFQRFARTSQGKQLLRQYFLRPSLNITLIDERLQTISIFLRPENSAALIAISKNLRSIVNIQSLLISLRKGISSGTGKAGGTVSKIWSGLQKFAFHAIGIQREFDEVLGCQHLKVFSKVKTHFNGRSLAQVGKIIGEIVDFEQSLEQNRTVVKVGVDQDLDAQKQVYDGVGDFLSKVARDLASRIPTGLPQDLNVIYFPQIGFLIAMPIDANTGTSSWEGSEGDIWQKMFSSDEMIYYKNDQMQEMDEHFGDIYGDICDREIEIVHELAQNILEHEEMLCLVSDICGELDCLLALAEGAQQYKLTRPHMTDQNVINIKQGWHILQELTVSSFVPNDFFLAGEESRRVENQEGPSHEAENADPQSQAESTRDDPTMLIMTGPNHSGKSVYLKQIALIVYMAHIGSFVPAQQAEIGITDKIMTRIATRETVSRPQSSFMIDLQQISMAMSLATNRSLLVIDEFGKGTNASDGAGLVCGVLEYLLSLGKDSPKVLAATHFHEIFENGFLPPRPRLQFAHTEILVNQGAADVEDQITYLYNIKEGRSVASYGTCCAALNGIDQKIIQRAEELVMMEIRGENLVDACAAVPVAEMEELHDAECIARDFLEANLEDDPLSLLKYLVDGSDDDSDAGIN